MAHPPLNSGFVTSSPPNYIPKEGMSPSGSYLGVSTSGNTWTPYQFFGRSSSTMTEDPKSSFTLSARDTEDDCSSTTQKPIFTTRLRNQNRFNNGGYSDVPLLDPQQEWRYIAYRGAYAHLLYVWGLPIASTEVLKYNGRAKSNPANSSLEQASVLGIGKASLETKTSNSEARRVDFKDHCQICSAILSDKSSSRRCQSCTTPQTTLVCLLCNTFIQGFSSPCLNCGHVLHHSCRQLLLSQLPEDGSLECISGCGCICSEYVGIEIESPKSPDKSIHAENSPVMSVVGDQSTNEQEQLGWYNSEWEDMAYESLARNLRPRPEIKPKHSQIWKGRKETT